MLTLTFHLDNFKFILYGLYALPYIDNIKIPYLSRNSKKVVDHCDFNKKIKKLNF